MQKTIKAILFDVGGTLHTVTNNETLRTSFAKRLRERLSDYGIDIPGNDRDFGLRLHENAEAYKHHSEKTMIELPQKRIWNEFYLKDYHVGEALLAPIAEELSFLYDYERVRNLRRPGMLETLESLRSMGIRMGVVSNIISTSFVPHILKEYGIDPYIGCIVMSSETGIRKPAPSAFTPAFNLLHVKCENTAYVGDTLSRDVLGAKNAGLALMIQIRNPATAHRDAHLVGNGLEPDYHINELTEIPAIISEYNKQHS